MKLLPSALVFDKEMIPLWTEFQSPESFDGLPLRKFPQLVEKVMAKEVGKEDLIVPFSDISFVDELGAVEINNYGRVVLTELAFSQLCNKLRVPVEYMLRCPLSLRNSNLMYWVTHNDERRVMLRIRKFPHIEQGKDGIGTLRAVLSHNYEPVDNLRLMEWVGTTLQHFNGTLGIHSARVAESSTHLRLVFPEPILVGEEQVPFYSGVHVSDSEVGERPLLLDSTTICPSRDVGFLYMVEGNHLVTQRHVHIDFKALRRDVADSFDVAKEQREILEEVLTTTYKSTVRDPQSHIRQLIRRYRMTNDFAESVIYAYNSAPSPTRLGVAFAFSKASRRLPIDLRINTESLVGSYLLEGA